MIGVGLVTCGRPDYYEQAEAAIWTHLSSEVDVFSVFEDGSDLAPYAKGAIGDGRNHGVAFAKNTLLLEMLDAGCDWIFLAEDDVVVDSPLAVTGYLAACESSGYEHLMFHGHGPMNPAPLRHYNGVTEWPNYVGAWCVYSREALERVGLLDEGFHNAWEHVEHTLRLAEAGLTAPWRGAADATGSENWLHEIPGSMESSAIRNDPKWLESVARGQQHWRAKYPETYSQVFGEQLSHR
jgi:hypothetical protein